LKKHKKFTHENISNSKTNDSTLSNRSEEVEFTKSDGRKDKTIIGLIPKYSYSIFTLTIFIFGILFGNYNWQFEKNKDLDDTDLSARKILTQSEPEDFYPVAEFSRNAAIILGCHSHIRLMPKLYGDIAKAINGKVPLFGIVSDESQANAGNDLIKRLGLPPESMRFIINKADSIWIRDYAPFILRYDEENLLMVDAKYRTRDQFQTRKKDDFMGVKFAKMFNLPVRSIPLVLEGGNFISNGDGLLLTSAKTLQANKEGKAAYSDPQLVGMFNDYLGVDGVFAVAPLQGEPNGHIDMFMTMVAKNIAVIGEISPSEDPTNSARLNETARFVSTIPTSAGPVQVKRIPMPPKSGEDWRSYTNVIFANGILLMPSFSDVDPSIEQRAVQVYQSVLPPGWIVKKINCDNLVKLHGQLHCISYNLPKFLPINDLIKISFPNKNSL
jgi:agmatine/peptidylarginine deiminase